VPNANKSAKLIRIAGAFIDLSLHGMGSPASGEPGHKLAEETCPILAGFLPS
jgi:hypothetical protein